MVYKVLYMLSWGGIILEMCSNMYIYIYMHIYIYTICVCVYICIYICMHIRTHVCIHTPMKLYVDKWILYFLHIWVTPGE